LFSILYVDEDWDKNIFAGHVGYFLIAS
jgi:hypothetical protein